MEAAKMPDESFDWDEARRRLQESAEKQFPDAWLPEQAGDELLGVVVGVSPAAPTSFGPSPVVEIEQPNGERASVWLYRGVLRRAFERQQVMLGELVLIRYRGKREPEGGGNAYHDYVVVIDRPHSSGDPDWTAIAARYGDDPLDEHGAPGSRVADTAAPGEDPDEDIPF